MTQLLKITLIGLMIATFSCNNRKQVDVEIDKTVMKEIFPSLMDSMYVEIMFSMSPPPVEEIFHSGSGKFILRPANKSELFKKEIRNELIEHKKDSTAITIVLNDTIHELNEDAKLKFQTKYVLSKNYFASGYKVDLDTTIQNKSYKIVLSSTYKPRPDAFEIVLKELSFSRILFNKEQNKGMLTCEYFCGLLCGNGYRIFIKQMHDKWIIDYIEHAWVA